MTKTEQAVVRAIMNHHYRILDICYGGDYQAMLRSAISPEHTAIIKACAAHAKAKKEKWK